MPSDSLLLTDSAVDSAAACPPSGRELSLLAAIAFVAWFLRGPRVLLHGRVFLEEGTTYLRYAWDATILRAVFAPHQNYYSVLPNIVSLLAARWVPLRYAGYLFAWAGLLSQIAVALILVTLEIFPTRRARLLALITFLLATPSTQPLFNTIENQFFVAIGTALLLVSAPERHRALRGIFLLFAGLSGPASCVFVPFFWLRAWFTRSRQSVVQAAVLSTCALLQAAIVLSYMHSSARSIQHHAWKMLGPVLFQRVLLEPWLSGRAAGFYDRFLLSHFATGWTSFFTAAAVLGIIALLLVAWRTGGPSLWLTAAGFWCILVYWFGASGTDFNNLTPIGEDRYWLPTNALIALSLLLAVRSLTNPAALRRICTVLLLLGWSVGVISQRSGLSYMYDYVPWQAQVEAWQRDPSFELYGAPSGWTIPIRLTPKHGNLPLPADTYDSVNPHRRP